MGSKVGDLIRAAREAAGLSHADVAAAMHPMPKYARGKRRADVERQREIAREILPLRESGERGYGFESPTLWPWVRASLAEIARGIGLPGVPDAWLAALGLLAEDVTAALLAHPERWDAVREVLRG